MTTDNIEEGAFIELNYTGRIKGEDTVFDTTIAEVAQKEGLDIRRPFKPIIICVGAGHLVPGLDKRLVGSSIGKHEFEVPCEEAFGKKSAKLLQLIPRKVFKEQNVQPVPGLEISVDDQTGVIRTVSGGRIIVDFNHPLASKDLIYDVEILNIVTDKSKQISALLNLIGLPHGKVDIKEDKAEVEVAQSLPEEIIKVFVEDIKKKTGIKEVTFKAPKKGAESAKEPKKDQQK